VAVTTVAGEANCSATSIVEISNDFEPLPGFEPGTYGLRNRISPGHPSEFSRFFDDFPANDVDLHASTRIFTHEPDRVVLGLLEAQVGWVSTHDRVKLRRALLALLASLDE
jgi:hypothetical protein